MSSYSRELISAGKTIKFACTGAP